MFSWLAFLCTVSPDCCKARQTWVHTCMRVHSHTDWNKALGSHTSAQALASALPCFASSSTRIWLSWARAEPLESSLPGSYRGHGWGSALHSLVVSRFPPACAHTDTHRNMLSQGHHELRSGFLLLLTGFFHREVMCPKLAEPHNCYFLDCWGFERLSSILLRYGETRAVAMATEVSQALPGRQQTQSHPSS